MNFRQDEEHQAVRGDVRDRIERSHNQDYEPGHDQHDDGADRRSQIRIDIPYTDLGEDGCESCEHRRQEREQQPGLHDGTISRHRHNTIADAPIHAPRDG